MVGTGVGAVTAGSEGRHWQRGRLFQWAGAEAAVCGGGRYNLAPEIGGHSVPCVGFGSGIERIIGLLNSLGDGSVELRFGH